MNPIQAANKAINSAGGNAELARLLDPDGDARHRLNLQWNIAKWRRAGVPGRWVRRVSELTGVPRHVLSPALYGHEK